jgi:hypothetical protein
MATRLSSTSAIEMIRKHDRRTYETPPSSSGHSASRAPHLGFGSRSGDWTTAFAAAVPPIGSRGFTGQGPFERVSRLSPCPLRLLPPRLRVTRASPQPDRHSDTSCRTSRLRRGWSHRDTNRKGLESSIDFVDSPGDPLARGSQQGRLPHPFAKRRCVPLHPRCLPSKDQPFRVVPFSTACHQPVEWSPRLFNLRAWPRTDGATGVRRLGPLPREWIDTLEVAPAIPGGTDDAMVRSASFEFYVSKARGPIPDL